MAKAKKPRTAKQKAASKKNIKKAIAALKRGNKSSRKSKRKNNPGNPGSNTKHKRISKENAKNFTKGFLGGTGAGEIAGSLLDFGGDLPLLMTVPVRSAAAGATGWWVGQKSLAGAIGGIAGELATSAIQFMTGRQGGGRLGGPGL